MDFLDADMIQVRSFQSRSISAEVVPFRANLINEMQLYYRHGD